MIGCNFILSKFIHFSGSLQRNQGDLAALMFSCNFKILSPLKGTRPKQKMKSVTPQAQISNNCPSKLRTSGSTASGGRKAGEPAEFRSIARSPSNISDTPKSGQELIKFSLIQWHTTPYMGITWHTTPYMGITWHTTQHYNRWPMGGNLPPILSCPALPISRFDGFRSRWTIFWWCTEIESV